MIIKVLNKTALGIKNYQDEKLGVWYQVLDQGEREGNYLEATGSSMFVYALFKAVRMGYIDASYLEVAQKGYQGLLTEFIKENEDGTISLTRCCEVAGLGGKNNRDGSYEYYINERIRDNDPKGTAPFIWASIENERVQKMNKND
jgi:unsaturated rhamnogalacturonyl hydrolase